MLSFGICQVGFFSVPSIGALTTQKSLTERVRDEMNDVRFVVQKRVFLCPSICHCLRHEIFGEWVRDETDNGGF